MGIVVAGLAVIAVGLLLVLFGIVFAWGEYKREKTLGATEFVEALANLLKALAGQPRSVYCFTFGTILIFVGGIMCGVSGLLETG